MKISCVLWILIVCVTFVVTSEAHAGVYSDAVLATGPTAYYRMNSDPVAPLDPLLDASGNGNDAIWGSPDWALSNPENNFDADVVPYSGIAGPSPSNGFGGLEVGNVGAGFSGNNPDPASNADVMDLPADGTFSNANATISFFMNTNNNSVVPAMSTGETGNDSRIFTTENFSMNPFIVVWGNLDDSNALTISTQDFAPVMVPSSAFDGFTDDTWHQVVVVRNGGSAANAQLYVDGVDLSASFADVFDSYSTTDTKPHIGARTMDFNPGWGAYQGYLDEFAYWDKALTADDVGALFTAATSSTGQAGDFDGDDDVDGNDFLLWQTGDSPNPGSVSDLEDWQDNFGVSSPSLVVTVSAVPEPSSVLLLGLGVIAMTGRVRRSPEA